VGYWLKPLVGECPALAGPTALQDDSSFNAVGPCGWCRGETTTVRCSREHRYSCDHGEQLFSRIDPRRIDVTDTTN
jgi:hypothetical protein